MNQGLFKLFLLILLSVLINACKTTKNSSKQPIFPNDWLGTYQGKMEMYSPKNGKYMEIGLKMVISETDTVNRWRWQMFYDEFRGQKITKDYAVFRTDSMPKGHYVLDENNGILLDRVLMGNTFYDCFDVGQQGLCSTTSINGNSIHFEVFSYSKEKKKLSIFGDSENQDTVTSFPLQYTQKADLKRVK
ncbi:MAG: hypothetical protein GY810_00040 [Aureispira sp.]|nr:hypothetical protein [Aureispira sp.]